MGTAQPIEAPLRQQPPPGEIDMIFSLCTGVLSAEALRRVIYAGLRDIDDITEVTRDNGISCAYEVIADNKRLGILGKITVGRLQASEPGEGLIIVIGDTEPGWIEDPGRREPSVDEQYLLQALAEREDGEEIQTDIEIAGLKQTGRGLAQVVTKLSVNSGWQPEPNDTEIKKIVWFIPKSDYPEDA
jgi:hypothetical protein